MQLYFKIIKVTILAVIFSLITLAFSSSQKVLAENPSINLLQPRDNIELTGKIIENEDISAIGFLGKYLLIGADEGNTIQVLAPNEEQARAQYRVINNIELPVPNADKEEIDIEGITISDNTVYVVGSHSLNRTTIRSDKTYQENLERLLKVKNEDNRKNVFKFKLDIDTGILNSSIKQKSLQKILERDDLLKRFVNIPSKENGIDIEGIAVKEDRLYFGFRAPVLRGKYVPVMTVKFKDINNKDKYELCYVSLEGNGIRDLVAVDDGFLILAGAMGDGISPYQVYFWDGRDTLLGSDKTPAKLQLLGEIPTVQGAKAEGLAIMEKKANGYKVLVVYDGIAKGNPTIFEIGN